MTERVQVIVEAKDQASGVMRAITQQFGALGSLVEDLTTGNIAWGNVAQQATKIVVDGMKESIRATLDYANQVRNLSLISGESAEETSRFVQVLDDFKITADDAMTATRALTKNGLTPNIKTLADLSDQYLKLNNAQERNEFVLKNLGRAGLEWTEVLSRGREEILAMGDAVDQNLILNQQALDQAREYEIALDNWDDSVQALKISIGSELLPILTGLMEGSQAGARALEILREQGEFASTSNVHYSAALAQARQEQDAMNQAMLDGKNVMDQLNPTIAETGSSYQEIVGLMQQVGAASEEQLRKLAYNNLLAKLSVDGLTESEAALAEQAGISLGIFDASSAGIAKSLDELNADFAAGRISVQQYTAAIKAIPTSVTTVVNLVNRGVPPTVAQRALQSGYAEGGISTGPQSGHLEMLHGTEAVIPLKNGSVPVDLSGGGAISVTINHSSMFSLADLDRAKDELIPVILAGLEEAKAQGRLRGVE